MRAALWPHEAAEEHAAEIDRFFAGDAHMLQLVLIATDGADTPVGFAELSIRPYADGCESDQVAYLEGWYVDPEFRRAGVGGELVAAAERWARDLGLTEFASDALLDNEISASAHRALGFEEVERIRCFRKAL